MRGKVLSRVRERVEFLGNTVSVVMLCLLAICMLAFPSAYIAPVYADESTVIVSNTLTGSTTTWASLHDNFSVNVEFRNVDPTLYAYQFNLVWNASILNCTSYTFTPLKEWGKNIFIAANQLSRSNPDGTQSYYAVVTSTGPSVALAPDYVVNTFNFTVVGAGDTALTFENVILGNPDGGFPFIVVSGLFEIRHFTWSPSMPEIGEIVQFNASSPILLIGNVTTYEWSFGDGNTTSISSPVIKHTYSAEGAYNVTLTVTNSRGLSNSTWQPITLSYLRHDVAITTIVASIYDVYQGWIIPINVTAANLGNATETLDVSLYCNTSLILIGTQPITLTPGISKMLQFSWNTANVQPCYTNYTIIAKASIVPRETVTQNNMLTGGSVRVRIVGDANADGKVDVLDLISVASALGSFSGHICGLPVHSSGSPKYNLYADINQSGTVNVLDLILVSTHLGQN